MPRLNADRRLFLRSLIEGLTNPEIAAMNAWNLSAANLAGLTEVVGLLGVSGDRDTLLKSLLSVSEAEQDAVVSDYTFAFVRSLLTETELPFTDKLALVESSTGRVNAVSLSDPWGDPVVVLDLGAQMWLRMLSKALLMIDDPATVAAGVRFMRTLLCAFETRSIRHLTMARQMFYAVRDDGDAESRAVWNAWATFMHVFVMLHEVGHVVLGHLQVAGDKPRRQMELDADVFALERLTAVSTNPYAPVPVYAFMAALAVSEGSAPNGLAAGHPGWAERASFCRGAVAPEDEQDAAIIDSILDVVRRS